MTSITQSVKCVFCQICNGTAPATIVHQDPKYLVFKDIKPVSSNHLLVVPRKHIPDVKSLTVETIHIVDEMVELGKQLIGQHGSSFDDYRMGFHWPPFNSIKHLHLHVIFPESTINFLGRLIFRPGSFYFATPESTIEWIRKQQPNDCN